MATVTGEDPEEHSLKYSRWLLIILFQLALAMLVTWFVSQFWPVWEYYPVNHYWDFYPHMGLPLAAGVFLAGELAIRLGWLPLQPKILARLASTLAGAYLLYWFWGTSPFHSYLWSLIPLVSAVLGFYLPGWIEWKSTQPEYAIESELKPHTVFQTLSLHLLPGAAIMAFFVLAIPSVKRAGFPTASALLLAILIVQIPLETGILLFERWRLSRRSSTEPVIPYLEPIPFWQYLFWLPVLVGVGALVYMLIAIGEFNTTHDWWTWVPNYLDEIRDHAALRDYPLSTWENLLLAGLVVNGVFGSLVEEIYFRGYLQPRIPGSRKLAPLANTVLFSLYHFYAPGLILARIGAFLPIAYAAESKRNIYSGIVAHILLNILGLIYLSVGPLFSYAG